MTRILVLVLVMLLAAACGGSPTPAPDLVATDVSLAVVGTLTALAPTETASPPPTPTPTLTLTWTPPPTLTAMPTWTPTRSPTATPSRTPRPTKTPTPTSTAMPSPTAKPKPTATGAAAAVPRACCPFPALVEVSNELNENLTVQLKGPEQVTLSVPAGGRQRYCLVPGEYSYTATAPGHETLTGTDFYGYLPEDCVCEWYTPKKPGPSLSELSTTCQVWLHMGGACGEGEMCPCPGSYRPCSCVADRALYSPARLKPGSKSWTLQQASAHCTNSNLCVMLPAPGSAIKGEVHIVGSANAESFQRYKVEWWGQGGSGWAFLLEKETPVVNGELLMLNTSTVPEGKYGLRLTVIDPSGNYGEPFEIWWTVTR